MHKTSTEPRRTGGRGQGRTGAVLAAWEGRVGEHLLGDLSVELGRGVAEVALHVDELLEVVKLAIHLQDTHVLAVPACMHTMNASHDTTPNERTFPI